MSKRMGYWDPCGDETIRPRSAEDDVDHSAEHAALGGPFSGESTEEDVSLRIDRVLEIRHAIRSGRYDVECRIEELLEAFETALSHLCRDDGRD